MPPPIRAPDSQFSSGLRLGPPWPSAQPASKTAMTLRAINLRFMVSASDAVARQAILGAPGGRVGEQFEQLLAQPSVAGIRVETFVPVHADVRRRDRNRRGKRLEVAALLEDARD